MLGVLLRMLLSLMVVLELLDGLAEGIFVDVHLLNGDGLLGLVRLAGQVAVYLVEDAHGLGRDHFSKDGMLFVEVGRLLQRDEELAAVGHGPRVGHAHYSWLAVPQLGVELVLEGLSEDAFSARASASGVAALQAEILFEPVEGEAIVVSALAELYEVLAGLGDQVCVDEEGEVAEVGGHEDGALELVLAHDRVDLLAYFCFLEVAEGGGAADVGREIGAGEAGRVDVVSFPLVLVHLVLDAPLHEALHVLPRLQLHLQPLLRTHLLFAQLLLRLPLQRYLLHYSVDGLILLDVWLQLLRRHEGQVIFEIVELSHLFGLIVLWVLNGDDVGEREWVVGDQVVEVFLFFVELLDGIVGVDVARGLNADDVRVLGEYLIADGILILALLVERPMHLDEVGGLELAASHGAAVELLNEGHDVDDVEDVALRSADGVLEGGEGEGAAVEGELDEGDLLDVLLALPVLLHFGVGDVHLVLRVPVLPHLLQQSK